MIVNELRDALLESYVSMYHGITDDEKVSRNGSGKLPYTQILQYLSQIYKFIDSLVTKGRLSPED